MKTIVFASALLLVLVASPAFGTTFGNGSLDGGNAGNISVGLTVTAPGSVTPGQPGGDASEPLVRYLISWSVDTEPAQIGSLDGLCAIPNGTGTPQLGFLYHLVGRDPSGRIVDDRFECVPLAGGDAAQRPPEPPVPAVPTIGEAWNSAQLPAPAITLDPATRGITGLETRISTGGPSIVPIAAAIRGYTITGTATLDHYDIAVDGRGETSSTTGRYVFETTGTHIVSVSAVWHGVASLTGPDLPAGLAAVDLGTATMTATRPYAVDEIRSILQP